MNSAWLDKAIPLKMGLTLYEDYAKYIVNIIYDHVFDKENKKRREALVRIIANLRLAYDTDVPLHYSRRSNEYKNAVKNYGVGYDVTMLCINRLLLKGLLNRSGFMFHKDKKDKRNRRTRVWASHNLISLFEPIDPRHIVKEPPQLIQLREPRTKKEKKQKKEAKQLTYPRTEQTLRMKNQIVEYHDLLERNYICVDIPADVVLNDKTREMIDYIPRSGLIHAVWTTNNSNTNKSVSILSSSIPPLLIGFFMSMRYHWIYRTFTGSFEKGGRYQGGAWMNLTNQMREYLKINYEPTIELDYKNFNARLIYHMDGLDYEGDDAYICGDAPRKLYKTATISMLNSELDNYYNTVKYAFKDKNYHKKGYDNCLYMSNVVPIVDDIMREHEKIKHHFGAGEALKTQRLESQIISNILDRFIARGIVALPVHDSVIVQQKHEDLLRQVMEEEYEKVMGFKPIIE